MLRKYAVRVIFPNGNFGNLELNANSKSDARRQAKDLLPKAVVGKVWEAGEAMSERTLKLVERRKARELARECWIDAEGDSTKAETLFRQRSDRVSIDPATILLILQIAIQLWSWWQKHKVSEPTSIPCGDEPVDLSEDND